MNDSWVTVRLHVPEEWRAQQRALASDQGLTLQDFILLGAQRYADALRTEASIASVLSEH